MTIKHEYIYSGELIPVLDPDNHADFLLQYQKAILKTLVKQNILTAVQCERCVIELECKQKK